MFPLSNLLTTGQIGTGDLVTIDYSCEISKLTFVKENHGAPTAVPIQGAPLVGPVLVSTSGANAIACRASVVGAAERLASWGDNGCEAANREQEILESPASAIFTFGILTWEFQKNACGNLVSSLAGRTGSRRAVRV